MNVRVFLLDHRRAILAVWIVLLLVGSGLTVHFAAKDVDLTPASAPSSGAGRGAAVQKALPSTADVESLVDTDLDGLPDVVENFVYGSDPHAWSTGDNGLPDGWLVRFGLDPTEPGLDVRAAAVPAADALPDTYGDEWPPAYRWTLLDAYEHGRPATWNEAVQGAWDSGVDPRKASSGPTGIPYAWLLHYGLNLTDPAIADQRLGGDSLTVRENYQADTDPRVSDTDLDGLPDSDELSLYRTDPRNPSTSGTGIPDGWLIRFGFDPADTTIGSQDPYGKGMTILDVFEYNEKRFGRAETLDGRGLDPRKTSTQGLSIPDGWLVQYDLDPLAPDVERRSIQRASDFSGVRDLRSAPAGKQPLPDVELTVLDAYAWDRPSAWVEEKQGPWLGGLNPTLKDQDDDGLPDAVEIRGWYANRTVGLGPQARTATYVARSNPLDNDTDEDGLPDGAEYAGTVVAGGVQYAWKPSDPSSPDTAFSGLTDEEKVLGLRVDGRRSDLSTARADGVRVPLLDPTRMDTDADYVADGQELRFWRDASNATTTAYQARYPGANQSITYESWIAKMPGAKAKAVGPALVAQLLSPGGDLDADGEPNIADDDADEDLLLDGWEINPALLSLSNLPPSGPHGATDPANPDTDGDTLRDEWEMRYGWDDADEAWDLDPSRWSSDGKPESDGTRNLDEDDVAWHLYDGPDNALAPELRHFELTNFMEQEAGTNPRLADENDDGVSEAWVLFWRDFYSVRARQANAGIDSGIGKIVPTLAQLQARQPALADPLSDVGSKIKASQVVNRFFETDFNELRPDETLVVNPPSTYTVKRGTQQVSREISHARATYAHTFSADALLGLNPYLDDTDRDGLTDAWEALWLSPLGCSANAQSSDPVVADDKGDPDADGLTNLQESAAGSWPCEDDTDAGGLTDGQEASVTSVSLSPINPGDDVLVDGNDGPDDGDGVSFEQELLSGTDPTNPDSDQDGLLDGSDRTFLLADTLTKGLVDDLLARGVAHRDDPDSPGGATITFLGEELYNGDPTLPDTSGDGIPDGWLAYYAGRADVARPTYLDSYRCGRPSWWDEAQLGPWWWGAAPPPGEFCVPDLDADGLADASGEDPIPAASHTDVQPAGTKPLPEEVAVPHTRTDLLMIGQAYGRCAGDPAPCRAQWKTASHGGVRPDASNRAPATFSQVTPFGTLLPGGQLEKGTTYKVHGKLSAGCESACVGARNRVVVAELLQAGAPARTLAVNFTDAAGNFHLDLCLCLDGAVQIPLPGIVALGRAQGIVAWDPGAAEVEVGSGATIRIRAYATTATFYEGVAGKTDTDHPQYQLFTAGGNTYPASAAQTLVLGTASIASAADLEMTTPESIPFNPTGRTLAVEASLADQAGIPLFGETITFSAAGIGTTSVNTDAQGRAQASFAVPASRTEPIAVTASYAGNATKGVRPVASPPSAVVALQRSLEIQAPVIAATVRAGEPLTLVVTVRSGGSPVSGVVVRGLLGSSLASATSGPNGQAGLLLHTTGLSPGPSTVAIQTDETPTYAAASTELSIHVVSAVLLTAVLPDRVGVNSVVSLEARLALPDGSPLAGQLLTLSLGGALLNSTPTDESGSARLLGNVSTVTLAGTSKLRVAFAGVPDELDSAAVERSVHVVFPTRLFLDAMTVGRGDHAIISGRLVDSAGRGLVGLYVNASFDGIATPRALTAEGGTFALSVHALPNMTLGPHPLRAFYAGSANGTYAPTSTTATILVATNSSLSFVAHPPLGRGNNTLVLRLRTGADEPVRSATIRVTSELAGDATVTTGPDGFAQLPLRLADDLPGQPIRLNASFAGDLHHGASEANVTLALRVPSRLSVSAASEAGRGATFLVRPLLLDDAANPIVGQRLTVSFAGRQVEATTREGLELNLEIPADARLGEHELAVSFDGDAFHQPVSARRTVLIKEGAILTLDLGSGSLHPGQPVDVKLRLTDQHGAPLAARTLGVRLENQTVAVLATTDADGNASVVLSSPGDGERVLAFFAGEAALAAQTSRSAPLSVVSPPTPDGSAPWLLVALGLALVVMVAVGVLAVRATRGRAAVAQVLREAARRIDAGDPWSAAVLVAYRRLSAHVAGLGFRERPDETAREFVQALSQRVALPTEDAVGLVQLFETARYQGASVSASQAAWARGVLHRILRSIDAAVAEGAVASPAEAA